MSSPPDTTWQGRPGNAEQSRGMIAVIRGSIPAAWNMRAVTLLGRWLMTYCRYSGVSTNSLKKLVELLRSPS